MATTPNYDIDYEDKRLTDVTAKEQTDIAQSNQTYDDMIVNVDSQYQGLQDAIQTNADKMAQVQQDNTDFAIEKIEQQKDKAQKDYTKEQSGAYVDWQKQSNQYGVNAEQMASQGMAGSGYSESSQVGMYNTYQNRVAIARESLNNVMMNYNNNIKEAILQNNSALAQIYSEASIRQAEIALEGFAYKNSLVLEKANKEMELKQFYSNEYQNVLNQMNTENAMAENVRQFNEQQALEREQMQKSYEMQLAELTEKKRQFDEEMARLKKLDDEEAQRKAQELELAKREVVAREKQVQAEIQTLQVAKEPNSPIGTTPTIDKAGNSASTQKKDDYYFSNGYQPRYIKDTKVAESGMKTDILPKDLGIPSGQNVWKANGKYYAWSGALKQYVDVTSELTFSNGYQPKYVGNTKLTDTKATIGVLLGKDYDLPASQTIWSAGKKFYVWDGKKKEYRDVTSKINYAYYSKLYG